MTLNMHMVCMLLLSLLKFKFKELQEHDARDVMHEKH